MQVKFQTDYTGLKKAECTTSIQKVFYSVVVDPDFDYKNKKEQYNEVYKRLGLKVGEHKEFKKVTDSGVIIRNLPANSKYKLIDAGSYAEFEGTVL